MKKTLRRIAALICLVTLFAAPATALAASEPDLIVYVPDVVSYYDYRPDPYYLINGTSTQLKDVVFGIDGAWTIPEGSSAWLHIHLKNNCTFRLTILKTNGSTFETIKNDVYNNCNSLSINFPGLGTDARYKVLITALSPNMYIYGYGVYY